MKIYLRLFCSTMTTEEIDLLTLLQRPIILKDLLVHLQLSTRFKTLSDYKISRGATFLKPEDTLFEGETLNLIQFGPS